jgi:hypothetical protein
VAEIATLPAPKTRPEHKIEILSSEWPSNLKSAKDAATDLGISEERLTRLADGGYAPHYRIDGGPPLFRIGELKRWGAVNLIQQVGGRDIPAPVRVMLKTFGACPPVCARSRGFAT